MINLVLKFDGIDYVQWSRSLNDILQISWPFLSNIVSGLEKPEPILKVGRKIPMRVVIVRVILMNVNPPMLMA